MSIFLIPLHIASQIIITAVGILQFFLLVRAVLLWKQIEWLKAFDNAGKVLVDKYLDMIRRWFHRVCKRNLPVKRNLLLGMIVLELIRLLIGVLG